MHEQPASEVPYRTQSIPQITLTCVACAKKYDADVGTPPGRCSMCHFLFVQENRAESARLYAASQATHARAKRNAKRWAIVSALVIGGIITGARMLMWHEMKEDMRAADNGGERLVTTDERLRVAVHTYAQTMCSCSDRACARTTQRQFEDWLETVERPKTGLVGKMIDADIDRMTACEDKLLDR